MSYLPSNRSSQIKGFTLIELLMVLGVIAVIAIGAFIIFPKVRDENLAKENTANIQSIVTQMSSLFNNSNLGNPGSPLTSMLIQTKIAPDSMIRNNQLVDASDNPLNIFVASSPDLFEIQFSKVSSRICMDMSNALINQIYLLNISGVSMPSTYKSQQQKQSFIFQKCASASQVPLTFVFQI